jgi:maltose-binding protein MalE
MDKQNKTNMKEKDPNFTQLCVWHGCIVGEENIEDFEKQMLNHFGCRVKYEAEVKTLPDLDHNRKPVPDTGDRHDLFFYVHSEDIGKFAVARLKVGIRWWEDVLANGNGKLYPKEFLKSHPKTW